MRSRFAASAKNANTSRLVRGERAAPVRTRASSREERSRGQASYQVGRALLLPFEDLVRTNEGTVDDQESDDALMVRFCRGDEAAFGVLYDRYARQLEAFLRRLVRDQTLAEDLLQTTFLSFVRARGRYVADGRAARLDLLDRGECRSRCAAAAGRAPGRCARSRNWQHRGCRPPATSDPPLAQAIEEALRQLPEDQREAVLLHKMHGLSFPEIALALGTTVGAAKVRAHRGYQRLKTLLATLENA